MKALKKQYVKVHDHNRNRSGAARMEWAFYEECNAVFGNSALANPVALSSSSCAVGFSSTVLEHVSTVPPPASQMEDSQELLPLSGTSDDSTQISVDELESTPVPDTDADTAPVAASAATTPRMTPTLRKNIFNVPQRIKRANKIYQTTKAMTTIMVDQLREMDATMVQHDQARMDSFIQSERELQQSFLSQLMTMQECMTHENREAQMAFLDRLFTRVQGHPYQAQHPYYQEGSRPYYRGQPAGQNSEASLSSQDYVAGTPQDYPMYRNL